MRHPVRDRLVMLLYALASFGAAGLLLYMAFAKTAHAEIVRSSLSSLWVSPLPLRTTVLIMMVVAAVLILLGVALVSAMLPQKKARSSSFVMQQNENGTVRISLKAIDALVSKCLSQHDELKVVSSSLFSDEDTVRVDVHIALLTDISMPLAISALQRKIAKYVEACTGVSVKEVRIFVDGTIASPEKAEQSKYAIPASILEEGLLEEASEAESETVCVECLSEQATEETAADAQDELAKDETAQMPTDAAEGEP